MSGELIFGGKGQTVMPFYVVCDVSHSMRHEIQELHGGVVRLWEAIVGEPTLDDVAQVCVMTFSDDAEVLVPLTSVSDHTGGIPQFPVGGLANYGAAFSTLAWAMAEDFAALRRYNCKAYRPCVYFLTDGEPNDLGWEQTFINELVYGEPSPIFVPFGFRDAQEQTLRRLAYPGGVSKWYHVRNTKVEDALLGILGIILNSMLLTSRSRLLGGPDHVLPEPDYRSGIEWDVAGYQLGY